MKTLALIEKMAKFSKILFYLTKFATLGIIILLAGIFSFLCQVITVPFGLLYSFGLFLSRD
jgi:hypothetical protein